MQPSVPLYSGSSGPGDVVQRFNMMPVQEVCAQLDRQNFSKLDFIKLLIDAKLC